MIIVRLRAEHIPRKKKCLLPDRQHSNASLHRDNRYPGNSTRVEWRTKFAKNKKKEADRTYGFLSGTSVSRKCALPFAPRYP